MNSITELIGLVNDNAKKLRDVKDYLNEAGIAKLVAYDEVLWTACFFDDIQEFLDSEEYKSLFNDTKYHREYYKTLRIIESYAKRMVEENRNEQKNQR